MRLVGVRVVRGLHGDHHFVVATYDDDGVLVKIVQASLQRTDSVKQRAMDIDVAFGLGGDWVSGTEAAQRSTRKLLRRAAREHGYWFHVPRNGSDSWVAAKKSFLKKPRLARKPRHGYIHVIDGVAGQYAGKGIAWMAGQTPAGWRSHGGGHMLTRARSRLGRGRQIARRWFQNRKYGRRFALWLNRHGLKGKKTCGLDTNLPDDRFDPFFNGDAITCWEEAGRYPGTHGKSTIDVIARERTSG